jgi:hypothetical protein
MSQQQSALSSAYIGKGKGFPKEKQQRGWRVLVASLAVDTLFTVLIFGTDGWISHIQRDEIIALENRLAARTLSDEQISAIADRLKQFSSQEFDIVAYWKNPESLGLANRIYDALIKAGWKYDKPTNAEFLLRVETGIDLGFDRRVSLDVAKALSEALTDANIQVSMDMQSLTGPPPSSDPIHKITISVGIKP